MSSWSHQAAVVSWNCHNALLGEGEEFKEARSLAWGAVSGMGLAELLLRWKPSSLQNSLSANLYRQSFQRLYP